MLPSAEHVMEVLTCAAEENQMESLRQHQVVTLPAEGELWIVGDLHDHRRNFDKLLRLVKLGENPARHLLLQELIHGDFFEADGSESSWHMLFRAAELKCDYPTQVHFLLANHDLAQVHGEGIMKAGLSVCEAFTRGLKRAFGQSYSRVNVAISEFFLSLPLAIRTQTGIFCSHSLPRDNEVEAFDYTVFDRALTGPDYARRTGPVYQLIWGRNFSPDAVAKFAEQMQARLIVTGHQPQDTGYGVNGPQHLILASDHNQGVFLPIDLGREYTMEELVRRIRKFVAVE